MEDYIIEEWQADNLITEIKELEFDKSRFELTAEKKCESIMEDLERRTSKINDEIEFKRSQLKAFFLTVERKNSKTQESYSMLSGKLIMKKPTQKITHDDKKLLEWAEHNASEYIDQTVINKLKWAELKKVLAIRNGLIVNEATGEALEGIKGIGIEEVKEQFEIK